MKSFKYYFATLDEMNFNIATSAIKIRFDM